MINLVAFVSDRSQNPDDREWSGPWVRPATQDVMLADFHGWSEQTLNVLKVRVMYCEQSRFSNVTHRLLSLLKNQSSVRFTS